jgi:predicted Zn-dependent protease
LLQNMSFVTFNGRAFLDRQSFLTPGTAQFDDAVTIVDFPDDLPGLPFDTDGTPKRRLQLVTAGVTGEITHDRRTALEAGVATTGSAVLPGAPPLPHHMSMAPGPGPAAQPRGPVDSGATSALIAGVGRGLLVTDFWYTRILDPKRLVVTGLTRNGVWLIENGEIVGPVRNMRFTQSYAQALAPGGVLGVGATARLIQGSWMLAWCSVPALRLASWNFTGGASG